MESGLFVFTLFLRLGILTHVPFQLPPHLPFNRAEIGTAIAIGVGLFPAAYWHRTSISQVRERMAKDAQVLKERDGGVHIRSNAPGEWKNKVQQPFQSPYRNILPDAAVVTQV